MSTKLWKKATVRTPIVALLVIGAVMAGSIGHAEAQQEFPPLIDLAPDISAPTDGAFGEFDYSASDGSTLLIVKLSGISGALYPTLEALMHTGPCVSGDPGAAGLAYSTTADTASAAGRVGLTIDVDAEGNGLGAASVPAELESSGAQSLLFYPSAAEGADLPAIACVPIRWLSEAETTAGIIADTRATPGDDEVLGLALTGTGLTGILAGVGSGLIAVGSLLVLASSSARRDE